MKRFLRLLLLAAAAWIAGPAVAAQAVPTPQAQEQQLLVMLRLPRPHYRPDSSYAGHYGDAVGLQARKRLAADLARDYALELQDEWAMPLVGVDCFVMRVPEGGTHSAAEVARTLSNDKRVAWAQTENLYRGQAAEAPGENKTLYPTQPAAAQWHLTQLHSLATGRGTRVAVIDSGVSSEHPDLLGQVVLNENFVDGRPLQGEAHGTAVAGIIAARADNRQGILGVAPRASLLALRACWQEGAALTLCTTLSLAKALHEAIQQRAEVINMSLGGPDDRLLGRLIDEAVARGIAVVAAVGSEEGERFPADHAGVLAVGSAPPLPAGAVLAPGRDVPATTPNGGWTLVNGSSFASAHAAGLVALLRELGGGQPKDLGKMLVLDKSGRIDTCATLARRARSPSPSCGAVTLGQTSE
ncbi:S8 family serine peptidase [Paucibacter sp. R3-3]|uniref:S8 family serine peptidase n=1 Tax=Roseateles agri TaxID=3098619 RepID=A0ABU5DTY8_9BURK|nr:S8 family serine peptidase [Paucibacter sp. R3-3]MDY0748782.1 S8 family serine peptidase [Paucibacter sp. R3-3]